MFFVDGGALFVDRDALIVDGEALVFGGEAFRDWRRHLRLAMGLAYGDGPCVWRWAVRIARALSSGKVSLLGESVHQQGAGRPHGRDSSSLARQFFVGDVFFVGGGFK